MAAGRPREFDVDAALDSAIDVFWRQGYSGTSIADLTDSMGITAPSIYSAFGNKFGLFQRAVERYTQERRHYLERAIAQPTAAGVARTFLEGVAEAATRTERRPGCFTVQGGVTVSDDDCAAADLLAATRKATRTALQKRMKTAAAQDDLPPGSQPAALARYLTALAEGINIEAAAGASHRELRAIIDPAMAMFER